MKKIISLLLVVLMLGSTMAFADISEIEVREADDTYQSDINQSVLDTPYTELWLQVDASGQIDVTVPLVLVFKTDIDGGDATSPETYKITNNSSADLVVTQIATSVQATSTANPMTLVAYDSTTLARDEYKAKLSVPTGVVLGTGATNDWDLRTATHSNDKAKGGLFELLKDTSTRVIADMTTGELSFVTSRTVDANGADTGMDTTKGVHLLTVTYTVAIDTSDAIGADITDNGDATLNGVDA